MEVVVMVKVVLGITLFLVVALWLWFQWKYRKLIRVARKLPSLLGPALPLIGHAHYSFSGVEKLTDLCAKMAIQRMNEGVYTTVFWCGPLPFILVSGSDDVKKILTSSNTFEKSDELKYLNFALGDGLVTAPGHIWKVTRKHINPLFHPRNLQQLTPVMNRNSRELISILSRHVGRGEMNVLDPLIDIAFKNVLHLIFGPEMDFDITAKTFQDVRKCFDKLPDIFVKRAIYIWLKSDVIFNTLYKSDVEEVNRVWQVFTEQPLQISKYNYKLKKWRTNSTSPNENGNDATEFLRNETETVKENSPIEITGMLNLIDVYTILQEKHPEFTDDELKNEMVTLYWTGVSSVSYTLSTSLLALAQYPRIQEAVYEEILTTVGLHDEITQQDLMRMPYLDMFFKEVMRWATLVPMVGRRTSADLELSSCTIPSGSTVVVGLFGTLMDPKHFPDPTKFDPERFSMVNSNSKEFAALPFSAGPRNCIGKTYAHTFVKTMVVDVVRHYKLTTCQDMHTMRRKWNISLEGVEGYNLSLQHRTAAQHT